LKFLPPCAAWIAGGDGAVVDVLREIRAAEAERLAGRSLADLVTGDGHPSEQQ
jgi:hypothetical protein